MTDKTTPDLTHVSTVQTWECDSNNHLNVQFFHQRFREAGYLYRQNHGLEGVALHSAHTRFHREIRVDETVRVWTIPVRDNMGNLLLLHRLIRGKDEVCCTCLDRLANTRPDKDFAPLSDIANATPRGLSPDLATPLGDSSELHNAGRIETSCLMNLLPSDLDHRGDLLAERLVASFSSGGQVAWSLIGATTDWLSQRGLGRVVLEMKFARFSGPRAGVVLQQTSGCLALNTKTFRFGHQIEDAITGQLYAAGEVLSILMDLKTRKSVALSDDLKAKHGTIRRPSDGTSGPMIHQT